MMDRLDHIHATATALLAAYTHRGELATVRKHLWYASMDKMTREADAQDMAEDVLVKSAVSLATKLVDAVELASRAPKEAP